MTFEEKRAEIISALENRGLNVEANTDEKDRRILVSLTGIGLSGVYATISEDEIDYQVENE